MGNKLDQRIPEVFGVDTAELAKEHESIINGSIADGHKTTIEAIATIIAISLKQGDAVTFIGAAMTLFAVGYKAGKSAPDLSVFEDALKEN